MVNPFYQRDIEDIAPGSGAVIQKGIEKVAVYKDPAGETHAFRAECPHLGCLVQAGPSPYCNMRTVPESPGKLSCSEAGWPSSTAL